VHGRNIKKGDPKYEAICPLCLNNDETQAHILLRCCHPAMEYWRKEYFEKCKSTIKEQKDPVLEEYLGGLWEWIATPLDEDDQTIIDMDSRRVAVMMGRPIREDLRIANTHNSGPDPKDAKSHVRAMENLPGIGSNNMEDEGKTQINPGQSKRVVQDGAHH
jgi:hypothetical protein